MSEDRGGGRSAPSKTSPDASRRLKSHVSPASWAVDRGKTHRLDVLRARGLAIAAGEQERIRAARDPEQIDRWLSRVATVERVADLFAGD